MMNSEIKKFSPSDNAPHILVVDDDTRIRDLLSRYLSEQGFRITTAQDAQEARRKLDGLYFDLLIIDVMMPGESGLSLTQSLKNEKDVPILMLTALAEEDARIAGLEAGADDYLSKPFNPRELVLRIANILKRNSQPDIEKIEQITFGPFHFSVLKKELKKDGERIRLTDREKEILVLFTESSGETIPRMALAGNGVEVSERTIDVQINRLRRKIEDDSSNPIWLQTVRGIGYRLVTE